MIQHFDNLHTPLRSIHQYPKLSNQENRFIDAGWHSVQVHSLWQLWSDPSFLTAEQRLALNDVEPFDEWEDFTLFASHYFLLEASNKTLSENVGQIHNASGLAKCHTGLTSFILRGVPIDDSRVRRRFGATLHISPGAIGHHGGLGSQRRINTTEIYRIDNMPHDSSALPPNTIEARMCHTITHLGSGASMLVGGRTSPDHALSDCWLRRNHTWERIDDVPSPLYRHCATNVTIHGEETVLIFGGRTNSKDALNRWLLWDSKGWTTVSTDGELISPRFGAAMASTSPTKGILFGGMGVDGTICQDMWRWEICSTETSPSISLLRVTDAWDSLSIDLGLLCRLGACVARSSVGIIIVGGVTENVLSDRFSCICLPNLEFCRKELARPIPEPFAIGGDEDTDRPLLVGHSVIEYCGSVIILGGGATCFSFGTYWNQAIHTLQARSEKILHLKPDYHYENSFEATERKEHIDLIGKEVTGVRLMNSSSKVVIMNMHVEHAKDFERVVSNSKPVKMGGMDLGPCLQAWSFDALKSKFGNHRLVCFVLSLVICH